MINKVKAGMILGIEGRIIDVEIDIGKGMPCFSKYAPSFFKSAGDKFTTILFKGKSYPEFVIADLTLSLDSLTSVPARPTIEKYCI